MTPHDKLELENFLDWGAIAFTGKRITLCSPSIEQLEAVRCKFRNVNVLTKYEWDIMNPANFETDILIFCNVFMYINAPAIAFNNVFNACEYVIVQDLINRNRGANIFGSDGDCMRYSYKPNFVSDYAGAFDLSIYKERIVEFKHYKDAGVHDHFITLIKSK